MKNSDTRLNTLIEAQAAVETKITDVMMSNEDCIEYLEYMLEEIHVTFEILKISNK